MNWYKMIDRYYNTLHIYTLDNVRLFVQAGRITKEEFKKMTGKDYDPVPEATVNTVESK